MATINEGGTVLFIGARCLCEELAAAMQQAGSNNLKVEDVK